MAFSGTVSQTIFTTRKVMDAAFRRCKMPVQTVTSEHIETANSCLYLMLSDLVNKGVPLWTVETLIMPLYEGNPQIKLPVGVVDVLNLNLRQVSIPDGTAYVTADTFTKEYGEPWEEGVPISTVGIKWSGPSDNLIFERSTDGVDWTEVGTAEPVAASGEWTWFDIAVPIVAKFFRVTATGGVLDYRHVIFALNPSETTVARLNRDSWVTLPNKTSQGRPLQYWFDRQVREQVVHLWPVPSLQFELYQMVFLLRRYIMDVGDMAQEIEVPQRWYEAIVAMLASKLASELVEVDPSLIPTLDAKAEKALYDAQQEERDNSPINWVPGVGVYTA